MTCAALLTPKGRSAVAIVEVRGAGAEEAVDACFLSANGKPLSEQPIDAIRFGKWLNAEGEELIVVRRANNEVEVHCHGGVAAYEAILKSLEDQGCERVAYSDRRQSAGKSPIADDAWDALSQATTETVAAILLDQAAGALDTEVHKLIETIRLGDQTNASEKISALLARRRLGQRLLSPWRVVLVGPPNVGKSSLINALLGYERALVYDQPGVTRDVVSGRTAIGGWPVELADTAGLRESDDALESQGVELAQRTLRSADVVLLVQEAGAEPVDDFSASLELADHAVLVSVASKVDLHPNFVYRQDQVATSVVGPPGISALLQAIDSAIGISKPHRNAAVPFRSWHVCWLELAYSLLGNGDDQSAIAALHALLAGDRTVTIGQESDDEA